MVQKFKQRTLIPNLLDGLTLKVSEPGTGVTVQSNKLVIPQMATLVLDGFTITVDEGDDFGGTKLLDLPDSNILLLGVEIDCVVTKAGTTDGIVAATDLDMSIGTAVASNATLSGAMLDVIEKVDIDTNALEVDFEAHSADQDTAKFPISISDGASSALYMNLATGDITASDSVSVDGKIRIYYIDLGNLSS